MALHSKWSSGDLIFYDGTQDIMTIKNGTDGVEFDVNITMDDGAPINFGASDDIAMSWTTGATPVFEILPIADSDMYLGSSGYPLDVVNYGNITYRDPNTETTTGTTITLGTTSNRIQFLTSTGAFNLAVPSATGAAGIEFKIFASTGGNIGVYSCGSTGGSLITTINAEEGAMVISDGASWRALLGTTV